MWPTLLFSAELSSLVDVHTLYFEEWSGSCAASYSETFRPLELTLHFCAHTTNIYADEPPEFLVAFLDGTVEML